MTAFPSAILNSCPITGWVAILNYCPIRRLLSICQSCIFDQLETSSPPPHPPPGIELSLLHYSSEIWCQKFFLLLGGRGWGSLCENFFFSLNMYQAKSGVKNFSFYWGGGPSAKIFFPSLNMYQAKLAKLAVNSKNFSFTWVGGPSAKFFFPVWTCINPNLVSKIFPFIGGGVPLQKIFFPSLNMYQAKSGVKNVSLYWGGGPKLNLLSELVQVYLPKISWESLTSQNSMGLRTI